MDPEKSRRYQAVEVVVALGARRIDTWTLLIAVLDEAIRLLGAERGYLIVSKPRDRFAIHAARHFERGEVPEKHQIVSRELIKNAWDMGDCVVTVSPFGVLTGVKGTYVLNGATLQAIKGIRSAIVAPLSVGGRMVAAIVLHEQARGAPFSIEDRRVLEPLALLASQKLRDGADEMRQELGQRTSAPTVRTPQDPGLIGTSKVFLDTLARADRVAATDVTVLITGESGTGKERFARRIHDKSRRAKGPFVAVNSAGLTPELLESELFGHERGAFTGALAKKIGLFEQADGGTLFLDEAAEMAVALQPRLLRVLQEGAIRPVGALVEKKVNVRVIAATNRDVDAMVGGGTFRRDVLHRLGVRIELPPLRERLEDLPLLAARILADCASRHGGSPKSLSPQSLRKLREHDWPGNVRELENVLTEAHVFSPPETSIIDAEWVTIRGKLVSREAAVLDERIEAYILACMALRENGSRKLALEKLGISQATLYRNLAGGREFDPERRLLPERFESAPEGD